MKNILEQNERLLFIIGYTSAVMMDLYNQIKNEHGGVTEPIESKYQWVLEAIQKVVYEDKPLPKMLGQNNDKR